MHNIQSNEVPMRSTAFAFFAMLSLAACGDKDNSDDSAGTSCSTDYECVNDVCECADGTTCADAAECEVVCEVCE